MWFDKGAWDGAIGKAVAIAASLGVALFLVGLLASDAWPRVHYPARGHRILPGGALALDGFTQPSGAYSLRRVKSTYAGPAVRLRRVDTTTADIGFVGNDIDVAAAAAFCTTACTVQTWYDQSGLGRNMVQATAASQPTWVPGCIGGRPCIQTSVNAGAVLTLSYSPMGPGTSGTLNVVGQRSVGLGTCTFLRENDNNNRITSYLSVANQWNFVPGVLRAGVADGAFHSATNVANGGTSATAVDGVETTYSGTASVVVGAVETLGSTTATCQVVEAVHWSAYPLTPTERGALASNQKDYWTPLPLDTFASPAAAYSMRRLKSTYAGPAVRLRRASDNLEADINFLGFVPGLGAPLDVAAANAHCAATACFIATWYDQSGNARHVTQPGSAQQPAYVADCGGGLPCARTTTSQIMSGPSVTPAAGPASFGAVARTDAGSAVCVWLQAGVQQFGANGGNWLLYNGGAHGAVAALAVRHAGSGVINGASSVINIDGTETTGSIAPVTTAGVMIVAQGDAAQPCSYNEAVWWNNYALTAGERTALQANQKSFWGTP